MKTDSLPALLPLHPDDFLPPLSRWMVVGGWGLMGAVSSAIALTPLITYNVTVRAPATVRPGGELRLVQSSREGVVTRIVVEPNQTVRQGQVVAHLDATALEQQLQQLQGSLQQTQAQLDRIAAQIELIETQIGVEGQTRDRKLAIAQQAIELSQQTYQQQQVQAQADLDAATAALSFAQSEIQRYQRLVASGAVSQLQLEEKQAAVRAAEAQVTRARAALQPAAVAANLAQDRLNQETSGSQAALVALAQERAVLLREQATLQAQRLREQTDLQRLTADLDQMVIRAPSDGVIFQLELRNPRQVVQAGETVATIAPTTDGLIFKAAVAPQDINNVTPGQAVYLRLTACPFPDYGVLPGTLTTVAPDVTAGLPSAAPAVPDPAVLAVPHFEATIQPAAQRLTQADRSCPLKAGMTAEARIVARRETLLQLILRKTRLWVR